MIPTWRELGERVRHTIFVLYSCSEMYVPPMLFTNTYVKKKNDTDLNLLFPEEELNYERTAAHYCTPDTGSVRGVERKFDSRKLTI